MAKKEWKDENGITIPAARVTKSERLREDKCNALLKQARKAETLLAELKEAISADADEVLNAILAENGGKTRDNYKGNFTFFNFDKTIKVEKSVQEKIQFDDAMILVAKSHFDSFLSDATNKGGVDDMIKELILDAFSTARGKLDADKVIGLTKYRSRIDAAKYPAFHLALDAIEKGMTRQFSKCYHRISVRNPVSLEYEPVNLNFSSL